MSNTTVPDNTAVRTALWRALHVLIDSPPHVLNDEIGLQLVAPDEGWRSRGDMHPEGTKLFRASIVARSRFIEDVVLEQAARGVDQYVILGAGLDTFAQRRPAAASRVRVFEIDQSETQAWKQQRLIDLGFGVPDWLQFVPVDFEAGQSWLDELAKAGFDTDRPAVVGMAGVSMYLTRQSVEATLREAATLAPGSTFVMSFLVLEDMADEAVQEGLRQSRAGAAASGTPFISFFAPDDLIAMARAAGFREARHVSGTDLAERYFHERTDGLRPANHAEDLLVAAT